MRQGRAPSLRNLRRRMDNQSAHNQWGMENIRKAPVKANNLCSPRLNFPTTRTAGTTPFNTHPFRR